MKIAILTGSVSRLAGGPFNSIRGLYIALQTKQRSNIQLKVFGTEDQYTFEDRAAWQPLFPHTHKVFGPKSLGFRPGIASAVAEFSPDIVQVHGIWMYHSMVSLQLTRRLKVPYIIHPHGMLDEWALRHSSWKKKLAAILYENAHLKGSSCIRALCYSEANAIRKCGLQNPICCIPNGVDIPDLDDIGEAPWGRQIAGEKKILLYLGRLHSKKGLPNLLSAWSEVKPSDWVLAIAGWEQNGHETALKEQANQLGLGSSVIFLGPQFGEGKAACYANADAFILPSFSEGLPMVILEAWAYHLPVIMTPQCNIPEGFRGEAALRIEPTKQSIVYGLLQLFEMSAHDLRAMGENGCFLVDRYFSWEQIAKKLYNVSEWVLYGGSLPGSIWSQ